MNVSPRDLWVRYNAVQSWQEFEQVHLSVFEALNRVTPAEAVDRIYQSQPIECAVEEYPDIRAALLRKAGQWESWGFPKLAEFARSEVARLDAKRSECAA